jgi:hypothetical protein
LKMVAASCARADRGMLKRTANTVAILNTLKLVIFISGLRSIFKVGSNFGLATTLKREYALELCNIEHPPGW